MKGNNIKLGFDSDRCVGTWRARTVNRIIALALVFALLPIWGVPYAFALGQSGITLRDELTVTADVVGGEEILPTPKAVLHAAIEQDVPEGYFVAYQWQRAAAIGVSSLPEPTAEPMPTPEPEPPAEPAPGVSSVPEAEQHFEPAPGVSSVPEAEQNSEPAPGVSDLPEQEEQQKPEPTPEETTLEPKWEDIPGAVEDTYTLTEEDVGQYVRVNVIVARSMRRIKSRAEQCRLVGGADCRFQCRAGAAQRTHRLSRERRYR